MNIGRVLAPSPNSAEGDFRQVTSEFMYRLHRFQRNTLLGGAVIAVAMAGVPESSAQTHRVTNTANAALASTAAFGTLTPGTSNAPQSVQVQFRLRSSRA